MSYKFSGKYPVTFHIQRALLINEEVISSITFIRNKVSPAFIVGLAKESGHIQCFMVRSFIPTIS